MIFKQNLKECSPTFWIQAHWVRVPNLEGQIAKYNSAKIISTSPNTRAPTKLPYCHPFITLVLNNSLCTLSTHYKEEVWQTLRDNTSCGPIVVTAGLGAVTCISFIFTSNYSLKILPFMKCQSQDCCF
jgi:hypothetical protein